jgi:hypothetical protein
MLHCINALKNELIVGGIFCDHTRVFDCVNHDKLLPKIENYGITGKNKELFQSYHIGRHQVLINSKTSHNSTANWALMKHGVPQGPILGSLLSLLYINDLTQIINEKAVHILFADATSILFTHHNTPEFHENIHTVLENVNTWFKNNSVSLNIERLVTYTLRPRTANPSRSR